MPSRRVGSSGFRRVRGNDTFTVEIRTGGYRVPLGSWPSAHLTDRAYDVAAWRLCRPLCDMNFDDVSCCEEVEMVAGEPQLVTREQRHRNRQV
jgi:hypothetical protein